MMNGHSGKTIELVVEKLIYGGDALGREGDKGARTDSRVVFIPYALPGEKVAVRVVEDRSRYVRAELVKVLEASPQRITARCPHFTQCGGCHYQHLSYDHQLSVKFEILSDRLKRIGNLEKPHLLPIVPSPQIWNYRNHVQYHLTPDGRLGFKASRSNTVVPVSECHLPESPINEVWPCLNFEPNSGIERIGVRLGGDQEVLLVLEGSPTDIPQVSAEMDVSVVHLHDGDAVVLVGDDHIVMEVLGRRFHLSSTSFFQINTAMAEKMVEHILEVLPVSSSEVVLDVYCGVGMFSAFLAPRVRKVIGVESSPSACRDFVLNLDEFENVELYESPAERALVSLPDSPDVMIFDPPRAGLSSRVLDEVLRRKTPTLIYISCDPSTLARDLRRLTGGGYQLEQVTPFDLFPQTYHIESISVLLR